MIPDFQTAMLPILLKMKDEKIYDSTMIRNFVVEQFRITEEGHKRINQELSKILLQNIENASPYKFEEIVV